MHIKSSINDGPVTDKLDYVVLERYIQPNDYGTWKICGKVWACDHVITALRCRHACCVCLQCVHVRIRCVIQAWCVCVHICGGCGERERERKGGGGEREREEEREGERGRERKREREGGRERERIRDLMIASLCTNYLHHAFGYWLPCASRSWI